MKKTTQARHRWTPIALAVSIAFNPMLVAAQQVTPAAGGPGMAQALNGVPVVNIVAPNGAGVSHNRYVEFNVGAAGLILNNSTHAGISQLGGGVRENPNLAASARMILNEVVAPNRSMLNGFQEVFGPAANVVLANPAGITCNGCGFINTPRATLTTGTPNFDGAGNLAGFSVRSGDIAFTGDGIDATNLSAFDVLARAVSVVGRLNATDLVVVGGAHDFDYATRAATATGGGSGAAPGILVDSSALGGMYADRIRLVATEAGVGVSILGDVAASVGDVTLTSAGQIVLNGSLKANQGNLSITYDGGADAAAISLGSGAVVAAAGNLTVAGGQGGAAFSGGIIGADGNATYTLASLNDSGTTSDARFAGGQLSLTVDGNASFNGPNWNGTGGLTVVADTLNGSGGGFFAASGGSPTGAVSITTAGNLDLGGGAVSGTTAALRSTGGSVSIGGAGAVEATGTATLAAATVLTNAGKVDGATVDVDAATFTNSGEVHAATLLDIDAGSAANQAAGLLLGGNLTIDATSLANAGKLQGTQGATIAVGTFDNSGLAILSGTAGGSGTLTANTVTNTGTGTNGIASIGSMTLDVGTPFTNSGKIVANQNLALSAAQVTNASLIQSGGAFTLSAGALTNNAGATLIGGSLALGAATVGNSGAIDAAALTTTASVTNSASGVVTIADNGSLTAASVSNAGKIQSFGSMTLSATPAGAAAALSNTGTGNVVANGNLTLTLSPDTGIALVNAGGIQAAGTLSINTTKGQLQNTQAGAFIRGGTLNVNAAAASSTSGLLNAGSIFSGGDMTMKVAAVFQGGSGAIWAQRDLQITASNGDIFNQPAGVILAGRAMNLTATNGNIVNGMSYGSGSTDDIGVIQSNGAMTLSASGSARGVITNHGWIDSNGGDITITANSVVNESLAPSGLTDNGRLTLLPETLVQLGNRNFGLGSTAPTFPKANTWDYRGGLLYTPEDVPHTPQFQMYALFDPATGRPVIYDFATGTAQVTPVTYLYRDWNGKAFSGPMYDRTPVQARIVAAGNLTVNAPVSNTGAEMRAGGNLTVNGHVTQTPLTIAGITVWDVQGQDRWQCLPPMCPTTFSDSTSGSIGFPFRLSSMVFDAAYRDLALNDSRNGVYSTAFYGTGRMVTMSAILQSGGGRRTENTPEAAGSNPGQMTITGGVTNNLPAGMIPGLSQVGVSQIVPPLPLVGSTGTGAGASGASPAAALIAAGVNLSLPSNPNGLFIINPDPNAKYLVELNPLYTTLQNILFGSDYLVKQLDLDPDDVLKRLGDASYEAELIRQQLSRQTGRSLLRGTADMNDTLKRLLDNAAWEADELNLTFGVALTPNQINALKQDMVWMVETTVAGQRVLAPVVYLSSATRAQVVGGTQIVADNLAVTGSSFINNGGTVDVTNALSVRVAGDIINTAGSISGGSVTLVSDTGNVRNTSVVSRLGDSENYRDVIDRGTIRSTGDLRIEATRGDVTNTGGQIAAGGDAAVKAGGDIKFEAVILESRSVTERTRTGGLFNTQRESTKITTTTQQAVGGNVSSGGNLTLEAGRDVTLVGSQAGARGDLTVDAANVNVLNTTTTNTRVTEKSQSGLSVSVSSGGTIGMGYGSSNSTTTQTDVNVVSSGLTSGGNTRITGRDSVTVRGSDVKAGGDLAVDTRNLSTQAAQQTTTVERTGTSSYGGMYAGGNFNTASAGWEGNRNDSQSRSFESNARVATLSSGGNMTLGNAQGSGTIQHQGTNIAAGGDFTQRAETIRFTAAENRRESSSSSTTTGGKTGINVNVGGQDLYDKARGGGVPDAAAPSVTGSIGGSRDESSSSSSSTTGVAGSIRAGGNVTTISRGTTTLEGTNIQSGGNTTIGAGKLEFNAASSSRQSSSDSSTIGASAYLGQDATGAVVGGASGNYGTQNATGSGTSQRAGSISSGGNTTIVTTGDATFQGTNLNTRGDTTISAGGKVDYQAAVDTASSSSSSMTAGGGFDAAKSGGSGGSKSGQVQGNYSDSSSSENARVERGGQIVSGGNVSIRSGSGQDVTLVGTDIAAGGNVGISGANVNLRAAESTLSSSSSSLGVGVSGGMEKPNKGSPDKGGKEGAVDVNTASGSASASSQQGGVITGRNVTIDATRDLSMQGTIVGAQDTAKLNVGGKLDMQSAQDRSSSSSSNVGVSVGGSRGDGTGGHAGVGVGDSSNENVVNRNAIVSGSNVQVTTGGDATLRGANIAGGNVTTNVGGNLAIESRTDVTRASNSQTGGYIGGSDSLFSGDFGTNSIISQRGELAKTGVGVNVQRSSSDSTQVTLQSGIVGQQSNQVTVTGDTRLTGARIGSDAGGNTSLATRSLTQAGVEQSSSSSASGLGLSAQPGNWQSPGNSVQVGGSTQSTLQSSVEVGTAPAAPTGAPIQPTVALAQLGTLLATPSVQTAMKVNRGIKAAIEQHGADVPVDSVRRVLAEAGVPIPANTSAQGVIALMNSALENGYSAASAQLSAANIAPSQADGILRAIIR